MVNLKAAVQRFEADTIVRALDHARWDRTAAAHLLGVPLRTLAHKIQVFDIRRR